MGFSQFITNQLLTVKLGHDYQRQHCSITYSNELQDFSVFFFLRGTLYRRNGCINFGGNLFDRKLRVLVYLARVESDRRVTSPPPPHSFFPNASDQNFEIAILFKILQRSNNYAFGVDYPFSSWSRAKNYAFRVDKTPHSPQNKGCKLCKLSIVNI